MKFSVLVPVYNVEKYLAQCVESVLHQTYTDFELILVNDGSTDRSGEICDEYAKAYSAVKAFHKQNEGQIATRCYALKHAIGDYIVFLDSDDLLSPNALEILFAYITKHAADCVIYDWTRFNEQIIWKSTQDRSVEIYDTKKDIYRKILSNNKYNSLCIKCIKRSAFEDINYSKYFHIRHGEDLLQTIDVLDNCERMIVVPDVLYGYRANASSVSNSIVFEKYSIDFTVRERVLVFLRSKNLFDRKDWNKYRTYCLLLLIAQIQYIMAFKVSKKQKVQRLKEIKDSAYYTDFLNSKDYDKKSLGKKRIILNLFKHGHYTLLSLLYHLVRR